MCLAVPAQLVEHQGQEALVDLHGNRVRINTVLVPEAQLGDWVLVHAGFAIQRLSEQDATRTWSVLEDLQDRVDAATSTAPANANAMDKEPRHETTRD